MSKPNKETIFLPITELINYSDKEKYYCCGVVFSPETENDHFEECPPYIQIKYKDYHEEDNLFFEVPEIIAYYGKVHAGYSYELNRNYICMEKDENYFNIGKNRIEEHLKNIK